MKRLPEVADLSKWLSQRIFRHEKWETEMFGMDWELHDDEEWSWELYFVEPDTKDKLMLACGVACAKNTLDNFLVSELSFRRKAWTSFEKVEGWPNADRPKGWQVVDALLQLTAWNVRYHGLNHSSVLAGMVDHVGSGESERLYFRPYGQWYSGRTSGWIPTSDGLGDGCEYLRPIPLSEDSSEGENYVSVDDNVWQYIDADAKAEERQ